MAKYEPDPIKLQALCRLRGGTDFACQWIIIVFKDDVTLGALARCLELTQNERMYFPGRFGPFFFFFFCNPILRAKN